MTKTDTQVAIASYCGAKITSNESPNATWCSIGFPQLHLKLISKDKKSFFSFYSSKKTKKGEPVLGAWLKDNLESKFHSTEFSLKDTPVKDEEGYVAEFDLGVRWDGWENLADAEKDKVKALYDRLAQFITSTWPTGGKQEENNTFMQWNERHPEKWHDYMRLRHLNVQDDQSEKDSKISDARNLIYFGAPGTGKSHQLKIAVEGKTDKDGKVFKDIEQNIGVFVDVDNNKIVKSRYERVTFYPTYSYAQFVGCYKPVMEEAKKENDTESLSPEQLTEELAKSLACAGKNANSNIDPNAGKIVSILLFGEKYYDSLEKLKPSDRNKILKDAGAKTKADPVYFGHGITMGKLHSERNEGNTNSNIAYKFVPGPFLRVLVDALKDHAHNHCLVIEEINRANAAAVFGDVFQLLDRGGKWSDGDDESIKPFFGDGAASEYDVAASEDIKRYLKEELAKCESARKFLKVVPGKDENGNNIWKECRLRIPSNMYIWATMNSADQGVFPMDTAFKRRWEFKYVGIDEGYNKQGDKGAPSEWVVGDSGYYWDQIRRFVNKQLSDNGVNEDKLMGPWFVKPENNKSVSADQFKSKVLMYLWEDAGRMCRKKLFGDKIKTYSDIVDTWPAAKDVFKNVTDKDDENWKAPWNKTGEHA